MNAPSSAPSATPSGTPLTVRRGRRPQDIEIVLRFDPAAPLARTEVQVASDDQLGTAEYLAVVSDAARRLATYAGDYRAAMSADQGDQRGNDDGPTGSRRPRPGPIGGRPVSRRRQGLPGLQGLQGPRRGAWALRTRPDGSLILIDPTGQPVVVASCEADQQRLRRLVARISTQRRSVVPAAH